MEDRRICTSERVTILVEAHWGLEISLEREEDISKEKEEGGKKGEEEEEEMGGRRREERTFSVDQPNRIAGRGRAPK